MRAWSNEGDGAEEGGDSNKCQMQSGQSGGRPLLHSVQVLQSAMAAQIAEHWSLSQDQDFLQPKAFIGSDQNMQAVFRILVR